MKGKPWQRRKLLPDQETVSWGSGGGGGVYLSCPINNVMEAMNSFVVFLLVFSSVVSCSKLDSSNINSRSVKKDSSNSDIVKTTNTTNETTTENLLDSVKDTSKKSINDDKDTSTKEPVLSKPPIHFPDLLPQSNISNISAPVQPQRKPFEGSVTITFVSIFVLGFLGVVIFYIWKRSTGISGR